MIIDVPTFKFKMKLCVYILCVEFLKQLFSIQLQCSDSTPNSFIFDSRSNLPQFAVRSCVKRIIIIIGTTCFEVENYQNK